MLLKYILPFVFFVHCQSSIGQRKEVSKKDKQKPPLKPDSTSKIISHSADTISHKPIPKSQAEHSANTALEEIRQLLGLHYISGTIYFSGAYFYNPVVVPATDSLKLQNVFALCRPGSIVTLDNCIYLDSLQHKSKPVNKSIKL